MKKRALFIASYDIADPSRLRDALKVLKGYASGRQKSVFECFLNDAEKLELLERVERVIDIQEDRFFLLRLDARGKVRTLGKAVKPVDPAWFYVG